VSAEPILYRDESGRVLDYFDPDRPDLDEALAAAKAERDRADADNFATLRRSGHLWNQV
jgi:hypothetical protein